MYIWISSIDLEQKDLIAHVKERHKGIIQRNSQQNHPPWLDRVKFEDEQLGEQFSFTLSNLDGFH